MMRSRSLLFALLSSSKSSVIGAWVIVVLLVTSPALARESRSVVTPHVRVALVSEYEAAAAEEPFAVAFRLEPLDGWHIYWRYSGDSGTAPKLAWQPRGAALTEREQWPLPERIAAGPLVNFGYSTKTLLIATFTADPSSDRTVVALDAEWLACKEECIPGNAVLELEMPIVEGGDLAPSRYASEFIATRDRWPQKVARLAPRARQRGDELELSFDPSFAAGATRVTYFPQLSGEILNSSKQLLRIEKGRASLTVKRAPGGAPLPDSLSGVLVVERRGEPPSAFEFSASLEKEGAAASDESHPPTIGFGAALLFAFLGGIILNLMPCVFPVLSIKVLGFVESSRRDSRHAKLKGLIFGGGVLVSFWALAGAIFALQEFGTRLGWGFQLQSPTVVSVLALLMFGIGLNLIGLFEFGSLLQRAAGRVRSDDSYVGSFLSGVLTTALATPCTAPFMGSAIGYALTIPPLMGMSVFTALALGVALPYIALTWSPRLLQFLPRPGAWMETFKQLMAFPMFATMLWLLWVLSMQSGTDGVFRVLIATQILLFGLWVLGRFAAPTRSVFANRLAGAVAACAIIGALQVAIPNERSSLVPGAGEKEGGGATTPVGSLVWEDYSPARLAELQKEGRPILLDFTAAWCVTCQVNKKVAFGSRQVIEALQRKEVALLRADWTNQDEEIGRAIESFGRRGVPVNVLYLPDQSAEPYIFPSLLTPTMILDKLEEIPAL